MRAITPSSCPGAAASWLCPRAGRVHSPAKAVIKCHVFGQKKRRVHPCRLGFDWLAGSWSIRERCIGLYRCTTGLTRFGWSSRSVLLPAGYLCGLITRSPTSAMTGIAGLASCRERKALESCRHWLERSRFVCNCMTCCLRFERAGSTIRRYINRTQERFKAIGFVFCGKEFDRLTWRTVCRF